MANQLNISVVITILNEEQTIIPLLDSLAKQTLLPKEIVLVDAGSTDNSPTLIKNWTDSNTHIPLVFIKALGSNRSAGRNKGIEAARYEHIAITDAGCVADSRWLEYLSGGFHDNAQAVAGYYHCRIDNSWQKIFSWFLAVQPEDFQADEYLPSSRSLALTKNIWNQVGKYPETLTTCEDLVFAKKLQEIGTMRVAKNAWVLWSLPEKLTDFMRLTASYARGDVQALYVPHLIKHGLVWLRYGLFVCFPLLLVVYMMYPIIKFKTRMQPNLIVNTLIVQIAADMSVLYGDISALWH